MTVSSQWLFYLTSCRLFGVGSTWRQRSRADGAGSDGVLEPLSLRMFAVRNRARLVLAVQCLVKTPALARKRSSSQWLLSISRLARSGANTRAQAVRKATTCLRPATTLSVGIEAHAATSVMVLRRQGPTLLSTEHCRHRLSVMVLRRQGERRMQLPR